jgi:hydroxylysine kinase
LGEGGQDALVAGHESLRSDLSVLPADIEALVDRHYGIEGRARPLSGEVDFNFHVASAAGTAFVVKLTQPGEELDTIDLQVKALAHLARTPGLPVPRIIPTRDGEPFAMFRDENGKTRFLRMMTFQAGKPLIHTRRSDAQREGTAALAGRLAHAFSGFTHPAERRPLIWDMTRASDLLPLIAQLPPETQAKPYAVLDQFCRAFEPRMPALPTQMIHNDLNLGNLLVDDNASDQITGCIDFGDMVRAPRIIELGVAAAYQIDADNPIASLLAMARGYHRECPLQDDELAWLPHLTLMRAAMTIIITNWRSRLEPANAAYILRNAPGAIAVLESLGSIDPERVRDALFSGLARSTVA